MRRSVIVVIASLVLLATGCSGDPLKSGSQDGPGDGSGGKVVVGSFNFGESRVLAHVYAEMLRSVGAQNVAVPSSLGSREVVVRALQDGSINLIPEYSGNLLRHFEKGTEASTSEEVFAQLGDKLPESLQVLEQAAAENKDKLVVSQDLAATGIETISNLAPRCEELVFGGPGEWAKRWEETIKQLYGCDFAEITVTDTGGPVTISALNSDEIDVGALFSTDPAIQQNGFVALEDDKNMFPAQNVVPLAKKDVLSDKQKQALNSVSAALTTEKLTQINVELDVKKRNPVDIAQEFLKSNNLL
ncbi:ABC transporter substrate-binding protein [Amycolatopsis cihanbeyliensis]|uniref:Osmoprotectant transport system substrate-binding protein n=1 Tax=Amycolatopsis cihanbeyliensis TaxID=1128664 RepID=A0A542DHK3_AMYCI|nr:ABC transporter substrate-binding protein [Amycolatopsis cihanbeyliensis]TQJ02516.1 osmoprotectant transport system substrate-binding protein [Amycolatopsis cihanbeyliensis]